MTADTIQFLTTMSEWSYGWWIINGHYAKFCKGCGRRCSGMRCKLCYYGTVEENAAAKKAYHGRIATRRAAMIFQLSAVAQRIGGKT